MVTFNSSSVFHCVQLLLNALAHIGHLVCFKISLPTMKDSAAVNNSGYKYIFTSAKLFANKFLRVESWMKGSECLWYLLFTWV